MIDDLRDLYQEVILDHYKRPRNFGPLEGANRSAEGYNPLCGDQLELFLKVEDGRVADAHFEGSGCAISTASASLMTDAIKGKTVEEVEDLFHRFHSLVTSEGEPEIDPALGKLAVLAGVRDYPVRVKCATLAWHTLEAALKDSGASITTE